MKKLLILSTFIISLFLIENSWSDNGKHLNNLEECPESPIFFDNSEKFMKFNYLEHFKAKGYLWENCLGGFVLMGFFKVEAEFTKNNVRICNVRTTFPDGTRFHHCQKDFADVIFSNGVIYDGELLNEIWDEYISFYNEEFMTKYLPKKNNKLTTTSKPITIFGFNWDMKPISTFIQLGYNCEQGPGFNINSFNMLTGYFSISCQDGNDEIVIKDNEIDFNCSMFNGCGYTLREVADNIVNQGIINNLNYESEMILSNYNPYYLEQYCGRGHGGDLLCVVNDRNMFEQNIIFIKLNKGNYGKSRMSFQ